MATGTVVDASKEKIGPDAALELVAKHTRLVVVRGKKVLDFDLKKDPPTDEEVQSLIIGRSGNLRAPAWTRGKTLVVGFSEDAYDAVLG